MLVPQSLEWEDRSQLGDKSAHCARLQPGTERWVGIKTGFLVFHCSVSSREEETEVGCAALHRFVDDFKKGLEVPLPCLCIGESLCKGAQLIDDDVKTAISRDP